MDLTLPDSGWTVCLYTLGLTSTLGVSIPVGFQIGVINAPAEYIQRWSNLAIADRYGTTLSKDGLKTLFSTVVSIFLIGGVIGSLGGAVLADRIGRKRTYLMCGILHAIGGLGFLLCRTIDSFELLFLGRFVVGLAAGLTTSSVPMYLSEVSPIKLRGTISTLCPLGVTIGLVIGQVASLEQLLGTVQHWHLALGCFVPLNLFCFIAYRWLPESPKYMLTVRNDPDGALREIRRIFGKQSIGDDYVLRQIGSANAKLRQDSLSMWSVITDPALRLPLILVCALQGGQQLAGINAVFYYSVSIFESVGLSTMSAKFANLGVGILSLFMCSWTPYLMGRFNRRTLSLLSCSGCAVSLLCLTLVMYFKDAVFWFGYVCIVTILLYVAFFQVGIGPIPYFIGSELFELGPRPAAMALGSLSSWGCNFLIGMLFPALQTIWGAFVFLPCVITCVALTLLVQFYLPETQGRDVTHVAALVSNGFKSKVT
ncbi:hypothetical protein pipiens_015396 [Culex pipiens pipiens]|uniref:Major facilitator superfamily (MFS) profile domain-containing protein n=1 Tax=Culex pipiens pipiens TaxID=38569 RepID=A0ABD1CR54_CULPP